MAVADQTGAEPAPAGLTLTHEHGRSLRVLRSGHELLRYVYEPWDPQFESPRPYFHPLRTLGGREVSLYRPHDHVWHKGLAWSLPNVGGQNFWGGPTYSRGRGYERLDNNGSMNHVRFPSITATDERVTVSEDLEWVTKAGELWARERREFSIEILGDEHDAWLLRYSTHFTNVSERAITFGSPTTEGRENAGYGGLFWRGPRSFTDGTVYAPGRSGGDDLNGIRAPWVAFSGKHDGDGGASTLVFVDSPANSYGEGLGNPAKTDGTLHTEWFVRTGIYACVSASPYYSTEMTLDPSDSFSYEYAVVIADGDRGIDGSQSLAETGQRMLGDVHRVGTGPTPVANAAFSLDR